MAQWVKNLTSIHKDEGWTPGLTQWTKDQSQMQLSGSGTDQQLQL